MRALSALVLLAAPALAQSNAVPGIDVRHGPLNELTPKGRLGDFPNGLNAVAMSTTSCNVGSVNVPWLSVDEDCFGCGPGAGCQMVEEHPYIAFLLARDSNGRFQQISDYSHVKHGFFALSDSQCDACQDGSPSGNWLGVGCSDTYSHFNNGDDFYLGPAEEIDPWLGTWDHVGSMFDRGVPDVGFPQNADGQRSWCNGPGGPPLGFKVHVSDEDLLDGGAAYYFQGYYVINGELEANRHNNARSRQFVPNWSGGGWTFAGVPGTTSAGSILERWDGATVSSASNGEHDGRVFVGINVIDLGRGRYRYEVAVHNRDAHRKVGSLSLPLVPGAQVFNAGFADLDRDSANDWGLRQRPDQLTWRARPETDNPLRWNSLFNFWFETDAAPLMGSAVYGAYDPGPGADDLVVSGLPLPLEPPIGALASGCSFGEVPQLRATQSPVAGVRSDGHEPGAMAFALVRLDGSALDCEDLLSQAPLGIDALLGPVLVDADGTASFALPIPAALTEPGSFMIQAAIERRSGGPLAGYFDLSTGLRIHY